MSDSSGKRPAVKKSQPKLRPIRIHHAEPQALEAPSVDAAIIADPADNTVKVEYLEDDQNVFQITIPAWNLAPPKAGGTTRWRFDMCKVARRSWRMISIVTIPINFHSQSNSNVRSWRRGRMV